MQELQHQFTILRTFQGLNHDGSGERAAPQTTASLPPATMQVKYQNYVA